MKHETSMGLPVCFSRVSSAAPLEEVVREGWSDPRVTTGVPLGDVSLGPNAFCVIDRLNHRGPFTMDDRDIGITESAGDEPAIHPV